MYHLVTNHMLAEEQGGFLPKSGIHSTIGKFLGDIYCNINPGNSTIAISFDLKKAFGTIDDSILLKKIDLLGFCGNTFRLLENYTTNRFQTTKVNNTISSNSPLTHGVPQGSTLGPLLFILYIYDLSQVIDGIDIQLYADDTVFYINAPNDDSSVAKMTEAVSLFREWCCLKKIIINNEKGNAYYSQINLKNP